MTTLFDGMSVALNDTFGAAVTWTPAGGGPQALRGIFREDPVRVADDDGGEFLLEMPHLRLTRPDADALVAGDTIAPGNGKTYKVCARHGSGSPASNAFVVFELELIP